MPAEVGRHASGAHSRRDALRLGGLALGFTAATASCGRGAPPPAGTVARAPVVNTPPAATHDRRELVTVIGRARPGDVIDLPPGTWRNDGEPVPVPPRATLRASRGATIRGAGVLLDGDSRVTGLSFVASGADGEVAISSDPAAQAVAPVVDNCSFAHYATAIDVPRLSSGGLADGWHLTGNQFVGCESAIFAVSARRFVVDANTMTGASPSAQSIVLYGGAGNVISRNRIDSGITGILFLTSRTLAGPADQFLDNVIEGNAVSGCSEEHISLDCHGNEPTDVAAIDHDVVGGVGPDGVVLLAGPAWAGSGSRFTGYHLMVNSGRLAGQCVRIVSHRANAFVTELAPSDVAGLAAGDTVVVGAPFLRTTIRDNTVDATAGGTAAISLYGLAYGSVVERNRCAGRDIRVQSLNSLVRADRAVVNEVGMAPSESNRVSGNVLERGATVRADYTDFGSSPPYLSHGNVLVDNDLRDGAQPVLQLQAPSP